MYFLNIWMVVSIRLRQIVLDLKLIFEKCWWGNEQREKLVGKNWWGKKGGEKMVGKELVGKRFSVEKF